MTRPGSVPLSELDSYCIVPHLTPDAVADRGAFYVRDGWLRPVLLPGHPGQQVVYVIDFVKAGAAPAAVRFALEWSPMREQVIELVLRCGAPVGPCRLVSRPLHDGMNIWSIVGVDDDGEVIYDRLRDVLHPETSPVPAITL